uniref:DUF4371 domain-containing protein n=1 Tax=Nicotiana tabacum TaxID=4097 RepID=A0A1S3YTF5_TOBAC
MALASQSQNSVKRYFTKALKPNLASHTQPIQLENINHLEVPSSNEFDLDSLKFDPRERTQILDFHPNHRDVIRREYLRQCPCQPRLHNFPKTNFSGSMRRFNPKWFDDEYHDWLEYSKDIVTACKIETTKAIIEELNGDYFALLVDESFDTFRKEQMAIVLRYVDRIGFVMERLIDIVHVQNTCASSLKRAIANLLDQHSLSLSYVRGQCYDGASNMQGSSFKRMDEFRESQKERIQEALDMGELTTGWGLNQEFGLSRACDTRWGSQSKSFNNFILMFGSILD